MATTKVRKSVPLGEDDLDRVQRFTEDDCLRRIVARHAGVDDIGTESLLMHTILVAGLSTLEEEADEERYAQLAASEDDEDRAYKASLRARRSR